MFTSRSALASLTFLVAASALLLPPTVTAQQPGQPDQSAPAASPSLGAPPPGPGGNQPAPPPPPAVAEIKPVVDETINVRAALWKSQAAWNQGDLAGFLNSYKNSPETRMTGRQTYQGFAAIGAHYRQQYPNQDKMGQLAFSQMEVKLTGPTTAAVTGHFHLERSAPGGGNADGNYELQMEKTAAGWQIVQEITRGS